MELWCGRLDCREFQIYCSENCCWFFSSILERVRMGAQLHSSINLCETPTRNLGRYFPELDASFRSPFWDKNHIKQVSSQVSSREVDSLVDIDGTLKITFKEKDVTGFWFHIHPELPELAGSALKLLTPFPNHLQLWSWIFNTCWLEIKAALPD